MSDRSQIEEIKNKLDIIDVATKYIPTLKKSGRNHFGLCPFHSEKTPSFSVNSELGIYKCFGCGESGDVISFIQRLEGLEFPEALEMAADRAGITLKKTFSKQDKERNKKKDRLYEANKLTAKFFQHMLLKHKVGKVALEYVKKRGLTKEVLEKFQIGYAPDSFDSLKKFLIGKKYSEAELVEFGLITQKDRGSYDKFRGRLMFPIIDLRGRVVGFSGRHIVDDALGPKYLNTPETIVYNKSSLLYGLYQGRESVRKQDYAIISEGQIDVLSSHKVGVENIVAPLGTALTEQQLKLIKRYADTIYFSFDTDLAGERALVRSFEIAQRVGLNVKAINLGKYVDADELIRTSPREWTITIQKAEPVIDHMIRRLSKRMDLGEAKGKTGFAKAIFPLVNSLDDKIEQSHYIKKLSVLLDTQEEVLREELEKFSKGEIELEEEEELEFLHRPDSMTKEEYLLALLLQNVELVTELEEKLKEIGMLSNPLNNIFSELMNQKDLPSVEVKLLDEDRELFEELSLMPLPEFKSDEEVLQEVSLVLGNLRNLSLREKLGALKKRIQKVEAEGGDMDELMIELHELSKKLKG